MAINLLLLPADSGHLSTLDDTTTNKDRGTTFPGYFVTGKFSAQGSAYSHLRVVNQQTFIHSFTEFSVTPITNDQEVPTAQQLRDVDPAVVGNSYQLEVSFFEGGVDHQLKFVYEVSNGAADPRPVEFGSCEMWLVPRRQRNL